MIPSILFILFAISWIVFRLIYFPFWIIWSTSYEVLLTLDMDKHKIEGPIDYYIFNSLLICLLVLHIYWWVLIYRMIVRQIKAKGKISEDLRSDSEGEGKEDWNCLNTHHFELSEIRMRVLFSRWRLWSLIRALKCTVYVWNICTSWHESHNSRIILRRFTVVLCCHFWMSDVGAFIGLKHCCWETTYLSSKSVALKVGCAAATAVFNYLSEAWRPFYKGPALLELSIFYHLVYLSTVIIWYLVICLKLSAVI